MGCNCGGAAPMSPQRPAAPAVRLPGRAVKREAVRPDRRTGGPGTEAYTWNGPVRPKRD